MITIRLYLALAYFKSLLHSSNQFQILKEEVINHKDNNKDDNNKYNVNNIIITKNINIGISIIDYKK